MPASAGATAQANVTPTSMPSGARSRRSRARAPHEPLRADLLGAGRDHGELVAADARQAVALAHRALRGVRDGAQHDVAGRVAVLVVDRLEVVEVEQHERVAVARSPRPAPARGRTPRRLAIPVSGSSCRVAALAHLGAHEAQLQDTASRASGRSRPPRSRARGRGRWSRARRGRRASGLAYAARKSTTSGQASRGGKNQPMNSAVNSSTGCEVARGAAGRPERERDQRHHRPGHDGAQPERHRPAARARHHREARPRQRESAQPDRPARACSSPVPGSHCTTRPKSPVAIHIRPDVKSGSGPSSYGSPSRCSGRSRVGRRLQHRFDQDRRVPGAS